MSSYVAITPARDEERLLPGLISSMTSQVERPTRWIVIDDGSGDRTPAILDRAAAEFDWIKVHHLPRNRPRAAGGESVVMRFLPREIWERYDFILRLDADLTFGPDVIRLLMREFDGDSRLGLAGPVLWEPGEAGWHEELQPSFHTRGAAKLYSRACFDAIGGLQPGAGWDTIDEATAMMRGFHARSFRHVRAYHHRPQGAASGSWHARFATGQAAYQIGYSPLFVLARAGRRMIEQPLLFGGAALLAGYAEGYLKRRPRAASRDLVRFVRKEQHRRLLMMESQWQ